MKLFMVLLGANPPGRCVEQHDFYFGVAENIQSLIPALKAYWPEAGTTLHIDGWREINTVDDYEVKVVNKGESTQADADRLFFLNLGGYMEGEMQETHFTLLTVQSNRKEAIKIATSHSFFKSSSIQNNKGASAHIDEKFGLAVDEVYRIDDLLPQEFKQSYELQLTKNAEKVTPDQMHLGYMTLNI